MKLKAILCAVSASVRIAGTFPEAAQLRHAQYHSTSSVFTGNGATLLNTKCVITVWDKQGKQPHCIRKHFIQIFKHTQSIMINQSDTSKLWKIVCFHTLACEEWTSLHRGNQSTVFEIYPVSQVNAHARFSPSSFFSPVTLITACQREAEGMFSDQMVFSSVQ